MSSSGFRLIRPLVRVNRTKQTKEDEHANEMKNVSYSITNNLRYVEPYRFTFQASVKERWIGKPLLEICVTEFRRYPAEYYENAIKEGNLRVNCTQIPVDYILQNGDVWDHIVLRSEPPVTSAPINIYYETDELIVISKPASIPIHPAGNYRWNSVVYILESDIGMRVYPIHRLDKVTTGLLLLAKSSKLAASYGKEMGSFSKYYYARVLGNFPDNITVDLPIALFHRKNGIEVSHDPADGAKDAVTIFTKVSFNGHTSLISCQPITGRTHQIRIHLNHIGFPIANDAVYGGKFCLSNTYTNTSGLFFEAPVLNELPLQKLIYDKYIKLPYEADLPQTGNEKRYPGILMIFQNILLLAGFIYLHAYRYSSKNFDFEIPAPIWCRDDFDSETAMKHETFVDNDFLEELDE